MASSSDSDAFFTFIFAVALTLAAVPFAISHLRHDELNLCNALEQEVATVVPGTIREVLMDMPVTSFVLKYARIQRDIEHFSAKITGSYAKQVIENEGYWGCYLLTYTAIVYPQKFQATIDRFAVKALQ